LNNYEKLLKNGISYDAVVFDQTPLSVNSSMTVGEYLNTRPQGLNQEQFKNYLEKRIETIRKNAGCAHDVKERLYKANMKARIKARISSMLCPCFFTQTLNEENIKIDYERKMTAILRSLKLPYVLVSDYGKENNRIHFHGFIDINPFNMPDEECFENWEATKNGTRCNFVPLSSMGWNFLVFPSGEEDTRKSLNYAVKYMTKDQEKQGFKHKVIGSRKKKCLTL